MPHVFHFFPLSLPLSPPLPPLSPPPPLRMSSSSRRAAGPRTGGMAGAGLGAQARCWLLCGGHGGPWTTSFSPSCSGCCPPGLDPTAPAPRTQHPQNPARKLQRALVGWDTQKLVHDLLLPEVGSLLNPAAIYANNEISLGDTEVYSFDYHSTVTQHEDAPHPEIFNAAQGHPDRAL